MDDITAVELVSAIASRASRLGLAFRPRLRLVRDGHWQLIPCCPRTAAPAATPGLPAQAVTLTLRLIGSATIVEINPRPFTEGVSRHGDDRPPRYVHSRKASSTILPAHGRNRRKRVWITTIASPHSADTDVNATTTVPGATFRPVERHCHTDVKPPFRVVGEPESTRMLVALSACATSTRAGAAP